MHGGRPPSPPGPRNALYQIPLKELSVDAVSEMRAVAHGKSVAQLAKEKETEELDTYINANIPPAMGGGSAGGATNPSVRTPD